jgi:hypothetical protein
MCSERPPGNGKGRRPRATTDTRASNSPTKGKQPTNDVHPYASVAHRLNQLLADAADVTYDVAQTAQAVDCRLCAVTSTHLLDAIDALYDAWRAYTGEDAVPL